MHYDSFCGAPGAAVTLEELHAMGCEKFIICGGAGSIKKDSKVGEIIIPIAAVRDEEHHIITWSLHGKWNAIKETADFDYIWFRKIRNHRVRLEKHGQQTPYIGRLLK